MTTKPDSFRCSTKRLATISAMISSVLCVRLRPAYRSANASAAARSLGDAGVSLSASGMADRSAPGA